MINVFIDLAISIVMAIFVFITIEEPFRNLGKLLTSIIFNE